MKLTAEEYRRRVFHVPFAPLNEAGTHVDSKFEKEGPSMCPNQPRV